MHDYIEGAVPVTEVAKTTRRTVDQIVDEARSLTIFIGSDWRGQPAVEERDAAQLVDGGARRQQAADAAWRAHQEATERWEQERERTFRTASQAVLDAHGGDPLPMLRPGVALTKGPREVQQEAQAQADRAVGAWERTHPAPQWQGEPTASRWRRLVDAVSAAVQ